MNIEDRPDCLSSDAKILDQQQLESDSQHIAESEALCSKHNADRSRQSAEMRDNKALLVRLIAQQKEELEAYKTSVKAILESIDRKLELLSEQKRSGNASWMRSRDES